MLTPSEGKQHSMTSRRIHRYNQFEPKQGKYVLYWMQQSQRIDYNHALECAITKANRQKLPVLVVFVLMPDVPEANQRHYHFMLEGLAELLPRMAAMGIGMQILTGEPLEALREYYEKCSELVTDMGYLGWQRKQRLRLGENLFDLGIPFTVVESDVIVPVSEVSTKEEYAAYSIRPKLCKALPDYLSAISITTPEHRIQDTALKAMTNPGEHALPKLISQYLHPLHIDRAVSPVSSFTGGYSKAKQLLNTFIHSKIKHYSALRSDPGHEIQSDLSPYLHFGQISALEVSLEILNYFDLSSPEVPNLIKNRKTLGAELVNPADFLEELIIRRELSANFCWYNPTPDAIASLPGWARNTLAKHRPDRRRLNYSLDRLESADTDDIYWNAAQKEMLKRGKMHNYMRMYWGKKMIEWTETPEEAYIRMLYLNNKYQLDGRDPNSFAGVAWCFGKHDRPWQERDIFGQVRYMNSDGLKRKFNMNQYLTRVSEY